MLIRNHPLSLSPEWGKGARRARYRGRATAAQRSLDHRANHAFYRAALGFGAGTEQPGAALVAGWYRRNLEICARLVQAAKPGDRVVVIYGSGHAALLRQCVEEMPGWRLVEANSLLP